MKEPCINFNKNSLVQDSAYSLLVEGTVMETHTTLIQLGQIRGQIQTSRCNKYCQNLRTNVSSIGAPPPNFRFCKTVHNKQYLDTLNSDKLTVGQNDYHEKNELTPSTFQSLSYHIHLFNKRPDHCRTPKKITVIEPEMHQ